MEKHKILCELRESSSTQLKQGAYTTSKTLCSTNKKDDRSGIIWTDTGAYYAQNVMNENFLKIQPWKAANYVGYNVKSDVKEIVRADDTVNTHFVFVIQRDLTDY
jgi:hypothetical protein